MKVVVLLLQINVISPVGTTLDKELNNVMMVISEMEMVVPPYVLLRLVGDANL